MATIIYIKKIENKIYFKKSQERPKFIKLEDDIYYVKNKDSDLIDLYYLHDGSYYYCFWHNYKDNKLSETGYKNIEIIKNVIYNKNNYIIIDTEEYNQLEKLRRENLAKQEQIKRQQELKRQQEEKELEIKNNINKIKNKEFIAGKDLLNVCNYLNLKLHIRTVGCIKKILQIAYNQYQGRVTNAGGSGACNVYQQVYNIITK